MIYCLLGFFEKILSGNMCMDRTKKRVKQRYYCIQECTIIYPTYHYARIIILDSTLFGSNPTVNEKTQDS